MPENQLAAKTEEMKKLKDQAKSFLDSHFFYAAVDMYKRVLAIDPEDRDSHLGVLMGNASANSEEELIRHYQNLYPDSYMEKRYACDKDEETIKRLCNTYWLEGYLSKEEITRLCRFDLSYDSRLNSRINQKNEFAELIVKDEHLSWFQKNDPAFLNRILEVFDKRINESKREDELNASLIKEEYKRFLKETEDKVKALNFEARERRDQELGVLADEYEKSQEVDELNGLIKKFEAFKDFKDAEEYVELCKNKIKILIDKKNNKPSVSQLNELLSYAKKALAESRFSDAYDAFMDVSLTYPQSEEAHLGLLEAKHKVKNEEELITYFQNLYNEDRKELIEACEEDKNHIEEMARKYTLPGYLEKEEILAEYQFDRNCESSLNHRLEEQKRFKEEIVSDMSFHYLETNGSKKVKEEIDVVYQAYQDRVDQARQEEKKNKEEVSNAYHRFLFSAYSSLRNKYQSALEQKDEDYKKLIRQIDQFDDERKLNSLIADLKEFGPYKDIDQYISLCKKKIESIKEKEKNEQLKKELETRLYEGKNALNKGDFSLAWRLFSNILSDFKDVPYAQLGLVMAQLGLKDEEKFLNYYKYLYSDVKTETLEACEEDKEFIEQMSSQFEIPGYLEKDKIRSYFKIDRSFASETANRIKQKKQIEEEFMMNPYLSKARENADEHIAAIFDDVLLTYDERIKEAQKTDELKRNSIKDIYRHYLKRNMRTVVNLFKQKQKEKEENTERRYQENVFRFNSEPNKEELEALIKSFDEEYKDGRFYIEECRRRLGVLEKERKQNDYSYNYETGIRNLKEKRYEQAKQNFDACLRMDPNNEEIRLDDLMADTGTNSIDELFDYYKVLYSDEVYIPKEAVKENIEHIEEINRKFYTIPGYIEKDLISEKYQFDRAYPSLADCRIRQKEQIEKLFDNDPSLSWLNTNGSEPIKEKFKILIDAYEERIKTAKEADSEKIDQIKEAYSSFLKEKDEEVKVLYQGLIQRKESNARNVEREEPTNVQSISVAGLAKKEARADKEDAKISSQPVADGKADDKKGTKKTETAKKAGSKYWKLYTAFALIGVLVALGTAYYLNNNKDTRRYEEAISLAQEGKYDEAIAIFEQLGDYKESVYYTKQMTYQKADQLYKEGNYYEAIALFRNLRFDDSEERANAIQKELVSKAKVNDYVFFGSYEQDGDPSNGSEPIEWIVLDKQGGKILLLSRYGLDLQQYSDNAADISWENSDIRSWLNETFVNAAFNKEDLNEILQTTLLNTQITNESEGLDSETREEVDLEEGKQSLSFQKTRDRVFLLSKQELETYFPDEDTRTCLISKYVLDQLDKNESVWWLRLIDADNTGDIQCVSGKDGLFKVSSYNDKNIVRPAIWIKTY